MSTLLLKEAVSSLRALDAYFCPKLSLYFVLAQMHMLTQQYKGEDVSRWG